MYRYLESPQGNPKPYIRGKKKDGFGALSEARFCQITSYQVSYCKKDCKRPMVRKDVGWEQLCWTWRSNCVLGERDKVMNLEKHLSKVTELEGEGKNVKISRPGAKQTLKSLKRGKKLHGFSPDIAAVHTRRSWSYVCKTHR